MGSDRDVTFKFSRPSGAPAPVPSKGMTEALRQLSRSQEMEPLLRRAQEAGREVVIEVFLSKDGQPLLIHLGVVRQEAA
jgi:hypothetical protein